MTLQITPGQREQLEKEQAIGKKAASVHKSYIKDFCQLKRESLFMAFSELPLTAELEIMEVKRMLFAVDTLEADIISQIDTGRMASKTLTDSEPEPKEVH
jgi:hypothetical protein